MSVGFLRLLLPRSIRGRLVLGIALVHAVLMTLFITDLVHRQRQFMQNESLERAVGLAQMIAVNSDSLLLTNDVRGLTDLLGSLKNDPLVVRAMVINPQGLVLGHTDAKNIGHWVVDDISQGMLSGPAQARQIFADSSMLEAAAPITVNGRVIGWARVAIDRSEQTIEMRGALFEGLFYTLAAIIAGTMFALWIAKRLTANLINLGGQAEKLRKGDRKLATIVNPPIEIAQLESTFKNMADTILNRQDELVTAASRLEIEIAENKRAEDALRGSEKKYRQIVDTATEGIWLLGPDSKTVFVNSRMAKMLGYMCEEMIGRTLADFMFEKDTPDHLIKMESPLQKTTENYELRFRHNDGSMVWTSASATPIFDDEHHFTGSLAMFSDITERKHIESQLHESAALSQTILNSISEGIHGLDRDGNIIFENPAATTMLGWELREMLGQPAHSTIHHTKVDGTPYPQSECHIYATLNDGVPRHVQDEVFWCKGGTSFPVDYTSTAMRNAMGEIVGTIVSFHDITERKHAEDLLRITASVFDISQEAIAITDSDNNIIDVNPSFTRITGYSREEVLGKNPKLMSSGRQNPAFYASMWQTLKEQGAWRGEIWNRRKSGEIYAEMLSIAVLRDEQGKTMRHVGVFSDISHIKAHEAELSNVANFDALTGIPNRLLLADRMKQAIAQTAREQKILAVCYLDLDGFKPINDSMGHDAGDQVLIEVARRIENTIRGGDTVARLGGDEFVVLLQGQEKGEECATTIERLLKAIARPMFVNEKYCALSASIGVSMYPLDDENPDTLLRHADQAMYVAKQTGKNRFQIYDPALDRIAREQHEFLGSIRLALENNQFELYYQPKINLVSGQLVGAEALIRWRHPERGLLSPAEFLNAVENTDVDIEIGEWVTSTALGHLNYWRSKGLNIEVSINISGYHMESTHFVERLQQQLAQYPDMPPGSFQIEVLETVALNDIANVRKTIEACRMFGVGFALDDFGTGYSSLKYLTNLPIDTLKIDQSFVRGMLEDKGDMAIVLGIITLARAFDRQTVAEGIETENQFQVLLNMGCELGQGYGIAHPMPADDLMVWHSRQKSKYNSTVMR